METTATDSIVTLGKRESGQSRPTLLRSPILAALNEAGTSHIYADTADVRELDYLLRAGADNEILEQVDGNTANQPLVSKVIASYLDEGDAAKWADELRADQPGLKESEIFTLIYAIICGRVGNDFVQRFAAGRAWEVSLQLHMGLCGDAQAAKQVGRGLREMVPTAFVKVAFAPQYPHCFLVARDLENEGIPVNFTSTFSARQAVAAALLANVTRTNIFMGRINQGMHAQLLGEHVDLEAQRALVHLRRDAGIKTQLIVASMREWQTFALTAGCDAYTAPTSVIEEFLTQTELPPDKLESKLETSYEDELVIEHPVVEKLGRDRVARLYRVEPELIQFLMEYRNTSEYRHMQDGDLLLRRFEREGFEDLFYAPGAAEWEDLRRGKVPDLDAPLTFQLALDTLYSLLADADFEKYQEEMDREIEQRIHERL